MTTYFAGLPNHWISETTGELETAIFAYLDYQAGDSSIAPTDK